MQTLEGPDLLIERGKALHRQGSLEEASSIYRQVLTSNPDNADALHLLGVIANQRGDHRQAASLISKAILQKPEAEHFHSNLGLALMGMEDLDGARLQFLAELEKHPANHACLLNLGALLQKQDKQEQAVGYYQAALSLQPTDVVALNNLGFALMELQQSDAAKETALKSLGIEPRNADALNLLGLLSKQQKRFEEAIAYYTQALCIRQNSPEIHYNMGVAYSDSGKLEKAFTCWQQTLALDETYADAHRDLGVVQLLLGQTDSARAHLERAVELEPDHYMNQMTMLFYMHCHPGISAAELATLHRDFGERYEGPLMPMWKPHANGPDPERRLRVGFVSGDFKGHPVGHFMADVLVNLQGMGLELYAYANQLEHDALTEAIKPQFTVWRECKKLNDDMLAEQIRADGIDILVDLSGHTTDNRLLVFARKPAPVQLTYLGYPDTTGLSAIDYILGDPRMLPPREETLYVETPWHLPDTSLCFAPPDLPVDVGLLPALQNGFVTFGCLNKREKVNNVVIEAWAKILHAVPASRLLLQNKTYDDEGIAEYMHSCFAKWGIEADRLELIGRLSWREHMETYNRVDIALDPFPYNGTTTSVEGLWMGAPLLTLKGDRLVAHMGESILHAVDMPNWIADDKDDYVAKAAAFSANLPALATVRAGLRNRLLASPICDAPRFASNLEAAFRGMWRHWCAAKTGKPDFISA